MFKIFKAQSAGSVLATSVGTLISLAYSANATAAPFGRVTEFFNSFNHMRPTGGGPFILPSWIGALLDTSRARQTFKWTAADFQMDDV